MKWSIFAARYELLFGNMCHIGVIILTVARFRLSYLYDHTDCGTLPFIIPARSYWLWHVQFIILVRSHWLWHASVHHTCTIILTVARFSLSYLYDHTDCGTLPFIISARSYWLWHVQFIIPARSYWLWHASFRHTTTIILTMARFRSSNQ
jgi:hypothetical protein